MSCFRVRFSMENSGKGISVFTKIRERVIIFGRNSIVYVDHVWTKNPKMLRKSSENESHFVFKNSPQNHIVETSIKPGFPLQQTPRPRHKKQSDQWLSSHHSH